MKKIIFVLAILFGGLSIFGQTGTPRTDGYNNITKGAFWSSRPEAKVIYEGGYPSGYDVTELPSDCFVRFVDKEHNQKDLNYIIFPKGSKIYQDLSTGKWYAAYCGNQIEFWQPVEKTKIVVDSILIVQHDTTFITHIEYVEVPQPQEKTTVIVVQRESVYSQPEVSYISLFSWIWGTPQYNYYCGNNTYNHSSSNVNVNVNVNVNNTNTNTNTTTFNERGRYQTEPFHRRDENPKPKPTPNPGRGGDPITPVGRGGDPIVPVAPPVGSGIDPLKLAKAVESKAYRQQTTQTTQPAQNRAQANVQNARQQSAPQTYRQPSAQSQPAQNRAKVDTYRQPSVQSQPAQARAQVDTYRQPSVQSQPAQARAQANVQPYRQPSAPQAYRPSSSYLAPSRSSNSGSGGVRSRGQHR